MSQGTMASFAAMAAADVWSIALMIAVALLSFSTLSALRTIHAKGAPVFKGDEFYGLLDGGPEGGRSVQMERAPDAHAARRRVLDRAMPARDEAFQTIHALAGLLVDVIREEGRPCTTTTTTTTDNNNKGAGAGAGGGGGTIEVDINQLASWYGFDLITTLAFGQSLDLLRRADYRWLPRCLQDASVFLYWAGFFRYALGLWRRFLGSRWPARLRMRTAVEAQRYADLADRQVDRRLDRLAREEDEEKAAVTTEGNNDEDGEAGKRKKDKKNGDIFGHLLRANLYSRIDLRADSSLLIAAGSDAVRFTIAATLFHWTTQSPTPTSLARATAEVRTTSGLHPTTVTDPAAVLGPSLRYLRACVDEAMRLNPPKPSSIPREVAASPTTGPMVIDGVPVPAGATVGVCAYALHRDPDIYGPDPHAFRPERWLARPLDTRMVAAFCPFLKGPRACPGKTVAYLAVQLALFHLLYAFDIEAAAAAADNNRTEGEEEVAAAEAASGDGDGDGQGRRNDFAFRDWVIGYAQGLNIRLTPWA
ncbi:cytochrome P450 monooxygenase [Apiospora marii]|uniref:Cytochrome P450 monooxygenase n=1 Tax=Apiospora marii TaxID=335849 RepID=A0ABR1RHY5_9PEZI